MSQTKAQIPEVKCGSPDKPLLIGNIEIPCYVLSNEKRVITQSGVVKALGMSEGTTGDRGAGRIAKFATGKKISPFVSEELAYQAQNPIKFKPTKGNIANGYEATILADLCDAVLDARNAGVLQQQQMHIATRCEILMRAFARVGIIALVDEATGYQYIRQKNELHQLLGKYISQELLPWAKTFPDEFYEELFRLRGWSYDASSTKRPILVGKLTKQIVYEKLPSGVLDELKKLNPKNENGKLKYHYHRFLTNDIGHPHLKNHLVGVIALMKAATNWKNFKSLLERAYPTLNQTLEIPGLEVVEDDDETE